MSQLTQSQRQKIEHFKSVTRIENDAIAQQALQRCDWDVTTCIGLYYENPDSLLNGGRNAAQPASTNINANANVNADAVAPDRRANVGINNDAPQSGMAYYAGYVPGLSSLLSLMTCLCSCITPYLPYFTNMFSMMGSSPPNTPYTEIITEFKENNPVFAISDNASVFATVRFGELMNSNECLFLFFNDNNSVQCNAFIKNVLCHDSVIDYLRLNMQCWIGDNRNHEGRHLFGQITYQWNEKRRPFVCIAGIHPISRKLVLVHRQYVGGHIAPESFIGILDHGLQRWQTFKLQQVRNQQLSQSNRDLREMQDLEYQRALQQQQQQQLLRQQAEQPPQEAAEPPPVQIDESVHTQNDEEQKYETRMQAAKRKIEQLSQQIADAGKEEQVKVALRLPNGQRVQHIFCNANTVESLFDFAMCHELKVDGHYIWEFELVCSYPKKIFTQSDKHLTLQHVGIERNAIIFVQESQ
mmetsp:Transcript_30449/g.48836  ORF Transcript_30449/g.48836 Transcript_30449/m.48836 type:complete len:469 (-) Transcript_30449:109-1515(-)